MRTDRADEVERICHDALDCEPSARPAFLDRACAGDSELRREVESLLAHEPAAERFLAQPALDVVARVIGGETLKAGAEIGTYRIVARLGAGAMGDVYRAHDLRLDRDVALKVLPPAFTADRDRLVRFEREARVLASVTHPHIATIYELKETGNIRALILELVEGETIDDRLARSASRRLLPVEAASIASQIAAALEAAHAKGIIHRDLKPANVKITAAGDVKVLDFGLARVATSAANAFASLSQLDATATLEGTLLGTPAYMSPEQAAGERVDHQPTARPRS